MKQYYVYILASRKNGTLYIGITGNIVKRVFEHRNDLVDGFTKRYKIKILVHYEIYDNVEAAILREKRLKKWKRDWKIKLIEKKNPLWTDLYDNLNA